MGLAMEMKGSGSGMLCRAMFVAAVAVFGLAGSASAKLTGEFKRFEDCPYANSAVSRCIYSTVTGGEAVLGSKKVPIVNPVLLQGGYAIAGNDEFSSFFAPKSGSTLAKVPQPVPGGLVGLVSPESSSPLVKAVVALFFENALMSVSSTLELAKPASSIRISENHLGEGLGVALEMPIKVHLENPLLGSECYVGSASSPIIWKLTTGVTDPPKPNKPIQGATGELELLEKGGALELKNAKLVDNSWSAPRASGCGGPLSFLIDPIVNEAAGLPSAAGMNAATLVGTIYEAPTVPIKENEEEASAP